MKQKIKWECACGEQFISKKKCKNYIEKVHWEFIKNTCGLASVRYHPLKNQRLIMIIAIGRLFYTGISTILPMNK